MSGRRFTGAGMARRPGRAGGEAPAAAAPPVAPPGYEFVTVGGVVVTVGGVPVYVAVP